VKTKSVQIRAGSCPRATAKSGFSYLELLVVITLISTLIAIALHRLLPYIREAERVAVLTLEADIRNLLMVEAAMRIAGGHSASLPALEGSNPMGLMLETPANYIGEKSSPRIDEIPERHWYFDTNTRRLVYRMSQDDSAPRPPVEFEVRIAFEDSDHDGAFQSGTDELHGIRLHRSAGEEWLVRVAQ